MNREALRLAGVQMVKPKVESKRKIAKDYHRNIRRIDAPDEARKVAGCPKCPSWFETVEARNAHKAQEHGEAIEEIVTALKMAAAPNASADSLIAGGVRPDLAREIFAPREPLGFTAAAGAIADRIVGG